MSMSTDQEATGTSTRPYLIRALHDWCTDNGFTPYLAVYVDRTVQVPTEYVKNNEIVLNVSFEATTQLQLGNEFIEFKARFGGVAREIIVPVDHVIAIYARENGQGMAFPVPTPVEDEGDEPASAEQPALRLADEPEDAPEAPTPSERANTGLRLARKSAAAAGKKTLKPVAPVPSGEASDRPETPPEPPPAGGGGRPALRRVK